MLGPGPWSDDDIPDARSRPGDVVVHQHRHRPHPYPCHLRPDPTGSALTSISSSYRQISSCKLRVLSQTKPGIVWTRTRVLQLLRRKQIITAGHHQICCQSRTYTQLHPHQYPCHLPPDPTVFAVTSMSSYRQMSSCKLRVLSQTNPGIVDCLYQNPQVTTTQM